ncbi:unnamed protein product [Rotaria sp. Silwood1]|nr:unnamed protein product [Rotaria sp. Silwood1]CAF1243128.1 unnamed protein product [Rotaria sp. Silwood1]CAF3537269.1 unnamed protein product [Rotaria sp. Silwood1]CAF4903184.1 unnamed protein product [Rotaria sp. Silwood1]CAF4956365.1 unnamed protein product [Rotaria sp. Silwood1]
MEHLIPCKDSIYCFDQYSPEKSLSHNQTYSHPCCFSELCRNIHDIPHSIQFTHNKHDVPQCKDDMNCSNLTDPAHRSSYRHTDLPDYLVPCSNQQQCRNFTSEHRKKHFHGEKIDTLTINQNTSKGKNKLENKCVHNSIITLGTSQIKVNFASRKAKNQSQQDHFHSSEPDCIAKRTRLQQKLRANKSSSALNEQSSHVGLFENEETNRKDLLATFYTEVAGRSSIIEATDRDQYYNPTGRIYDLGRDDAFNGYSILIAQFYIDSQFNDTAMKVPIDALKVKGFQVIHVKTEDECITQMASNRYDIVWVISTNQIQNSSFISALTKYHSSGGAIFLFADNAPYVCHVSEFLKTKFGITVEGNYYGDKTLAYKENGHQKTGHFGQHDIFTGIENLYEGVTICHPVFSTPASRTKFTVIATATDGNASIAVYDPPATSTEGRLCLDCGFTKLYIKWDSAGTARYIVNASCWLLGMEKRMKQNRLN